MKKNKIQTIARSVQAATLLALALQTPLAVSQQTQPYSVQYPNGATYQGEAIGTTLHGRGVMTWPSGERYEGEFSQGKRNGRGRYSWPDGNVYDGIFVNGEKHGKGIYSWANGNRYEGDFVNDQRTGQGKFVWANGDVYEGDFVNGKKHGRGALLWASGMRYEGPFVEDARTGQGSYRWPDGNRYSGDFVDGERTGQGIFVTADGNRYEGSFVKGQQQGEGTFIWKDGSRYQGMFAASKRHGQGSYTWADGSQYTGDFVENERTGNGVFSTTAGYFYQGGFLNGKQHGAGIEKLPNGTQYQGQFSEGKRHGEGITTDNTGRQTAQVWNMGNLVSPPPLTSAEAPKPEPEARSKAAKGTPAKTGASVNAKAAPAARDPEMAQLEAAVKEFDAGRYPVAAKQYRQILQANPNNALAWLFLAQAQEKMDEKMPAQKSYRRVLSLQQEGPAADAARQALERFEQEQARAEAGLLARFYFDYPFEPPGRRDWRLVKPDRWLEVYPDGRFEAFRVTEVAQLGACLGMLTQKENEESFEVFIPFDGCDKMWLRFRRGQGEWQWLGEMKEVQWR